VTTFTDFVPNNVAPFSFQPTLDGQVYTVRVTWNVFGQRWYVNLYDLAFDKPEVHVTRKGRDLYYGIFADIWPRNKKIELRGLDKNTTYEVYDYANRRSLGDLKGADPYLQIGFKDSLLIRVRPR